MAQDNEKIKADIRYLKSQADAAADRGDWNTVKSIDELIQNAKSRLSPEQEKEKPEVPKKGAWGSFVSGAARQGGRYNARFEQIYDLIKDDQQALDKLANEQRQNESFYLEATGEHPVARTLGEGAALLPFSAGRSMPSAMVRGMLGGALTYNEDPGETALQSAMGGASNALGYGLLGRVGANKFASRALNNNFLTLPEQRGPTLLKDDFIQSLTSFQNEAATLGKINAKTITNEALRTIGIEGKSFSDETLGDAGKRIGKLFDSALSGKENMYLGGRYTSKIGVILDELKDRPVKSDKAVRAAKFMLEKAKSNNGVIDIGEYQKLRSQLTEDILSTKNAKVKRALGKMVEVLDDSAASQLPKDKKAMLQQARSQWRQYSLLKTPGVIDWKNGGIINTGKLAALLARRDEPGFTLNKDQGKLYELLRLDRQTPYSTSNVDPLEALRDFRHHNVLGRAFMSPIESGIMGFSRLPTRVIEGGPLSLTVPLLHQRIPPRDDENRGLSILR